MGFDIEIAWKRIKENFKRPELVDEIKKTPVLYARLEDKTVARYSNVDDTITLNTTRVGNRFANGKTVGEVLDGLVQYSHYASPVIDSMFHESSHKIQNLYGLKNTRILSDIFHDDAETVKWNKYEEGTATAYGTFMKNLIFLGGNEKETIRRAEKELWTTKNDLEKIIDDRKDALEYKDFYGHYSSEVEIFEKELKSAKNELEIYTEPALKIPSEVSSSKSTKIEEYVSGDKTIYISFK